MQIEDYNMISALSEKFEFFSYNHAHALEIITKAFPAEWKDILSTRQERGISG